MGDYSMVGRRLQKPERFNEKNTSPVMTSGAFFFFETDDFPGFFRGAASD
jgi:hypothetical protein